jgi:hypothetical protein
VRPSPKGRRILQRDSSLVEDLEWVRDLWEEEASGSLVGPNLGGVGHYEEHMLDSHVDLQAGRDSAASAEMPLPRSGCHRVECHTSLEES